jgi:hypothetical protein
MTPAELRSAVDMALAGEWDEAHGIVQADEAVYPTAEALFAIGLYLRSEQAHPQ